MEHCRTRMSHTEHEAIRENRLEEIRLSAGFPKGSESNNEIKDEILPHSGNEEWNENRGRGVLSEGCKGETSRT